MSLTDLLFAELGLPVLMEYSSGPIRYADPDVPAVDLTALVGPERSEEESDLDRRRRIRIREAKIHRDPAGPWGGVADPRSDATVTIDGLEYSVREISLSGTMATLVLIRAETLERTKPGYRNPTRLR
jgi:hypothetical protein